MATTTTVVDSNTTQNQIDSYLNTLSQKYLANTEYILSGTSTGYVTAGVVALAPYANLTNRYYPTVATLPNEGDNLKTREELGGYFVPSNLGASIYLTKNITYILDTNSIQYGAIYRYIQPNLYNKGRGLTQNDQDSVITHIVGNNWMKALNTSSIFDGNIVNSSFYQKFIPYQSSYETTQSDSNGVINARDDFEFWVGAQKQTWYTTNSATTLTPEKYFDLTSRINNLIFTPGQELYSWNTDIFGNQYALYKTLRTPKSLFAAASSVGNLYVKTADSTISTGPSALNLIYRKYIGQTFYNELTGNNIVNFEVFFDTLVIQLSSIVLFEKINFNYETYQIESALQSFLPLRYTPFTNEEGNQTLSNALSTRSFQNTWGIPGVSAVTYYGGNWYDTNNKTITICTLLSSTLSGNSQSIISTSGVSSLVVPVLYNLDLNKPDNRTRIYPIETSDFTEYIYPLNNGRGITYMEPPVFTYNEDTKTFLTTFITFSGDDSNSVKYGSANQEAYLLCYKVKA